MRCRPLLMTADTNAVKGRTASRHTFCSSSGDLELERQILTGGSGSVRFQSMPRPGDLAVVIRGAFWPNGNPVGPRSSARQPGDRHHSLQSNRSMMLPVEQDLAARDLANEGTGVVELR